MASFEPLEDRRLLTVFFEKIFSPDTIGPGSVSTLTFTIENDPGEVAEVAEDIAFSDTLPTGVFIAPAPQITSDFIGLFSAPAGGTTITLTDGMLGIGETGTFSVDVTAATAGAYVNVTGDLTSSQGNSGTATDTLSVVTSLPGFTKGFFTEGGEEPILVETIPLGGRTTLTFTIEAPQDESSVEDVSFTDNLPVGLVVANPSNASVTGFNESTPVDLTAVPGSNVISVFANGSFLAPAIESGDTGTISVDVIATAAGVLGNTTEELIVDLATDVPVGKASASIEVTAPAAIQAITTFTDDPVPPGGQVNAEIAIDNLDRIDSATNISFSLDLESALSGLAPVGLPQNDVLGPGSLLSFFEGSLLLTGGSLPPEGMGTIDVTLDVPGGASPGAYSFDASITADIGGDGVVGDPVTDLLFVEAFPTLAISYDPNPVAAGGTTTLEFTVTNTDPSNPATDIALELEFPDIVPDATVTPQAGDLGPNSVFTFTPRTNPPPPSSSTPAKLTLTAGSLAAGVTGNFSITVEIATDAQSGVYPTMTSDITATVDGQAVVGKPGSDDLLVVGAPQVTLEFTDDPVRPGETANLEITVAHTDAEGVGDATGIGFTIDLNAALTDLTATGLPQADVVGPGSSLTGSASDTFLTLSGGTLTPGTSATFSVTVLVPATAALGIHPVETSEITATVGGVATNGPAASDDLLVTELLFTKEFIGDPVVPSETATLRFTFTNQSPDTSVTNISFTDDLAEALTGLTPTLPLPDSPLDGTLICNPPSELEFSGGTLGPNSSEFFDVTVEVPGNAEQGEYSNATSNLTYIFDGNEVVDSPAFDDLTVLEAISLEKTVLGGPVAPGAMSSIQYTLTNNSTQSELTEIAFTDDLDAALSGLRATGLPQTDIVGVGSLIDDEFDTGLLEFSGGTLAAGASASFVVDVQVPSEAAPGPYPGTTSDVTGDLGGTTVTSDGSTGTLEVVLEPDFGDAPDSYKTRILSDGPRHLATGPRLGALRDTELDAQAPTNGTGDDVNGDDDEDGVTFTSVLLPGETATVDVVASAAGRLDAFVDFNGNGSFADPGEKIFDDFLLTADTNNLDFPVPPEAVAGLTYARFRISTDGGLSFDGPADDGEVEDYRIVVPWQAESDLFHQVGGPAGDGWSANPAQDSAGYLSFGPYTTGIPGQHTVRFRLKVDDVSVDSLPLATVDVFDASTGQVLAERIVHRSAFTQPDTYEFIELTFGDEAGSVLEFRVFWNGATLMTLDRIELALDTSIAPDPDDLQTTFEAEQDLLHQIGRAEGDGWSANMLDDPTGFLAFGPYTQVVPAGQRTAAWHLMVDNNTADNSPVVTVDVFDATGGQLLARRVIRRGEFTAPMTYQPFFVHFTSELIRILEFRTFYHDTASVNLDKVVLFDNHVFQAEHALFHLVGRPDEDGWSADPAQDEAGFLSYGPYTTQIPTGQHVAWFELMVDNHTGDNLPVVTIDVFDFTALEVLAQRTIHRTEFDGSFAYQTFGLEFSAEENREMEFRTFWHDTTYVRQNSVAIEQDASIPVNTTNPLEAYEAETQLPHQIGRLDGAGWSASTALDPSGFLSYGPYTRTIPQGTHSARFQMKVDDNTVDNQHVATIDVFDPENGTLLAKRVVRRQDFDAADTYQNIDLLFGADDNQLLEFRVLWHDLVDAAIDSITIFGDQDN